jgi:hypothetical protein
MTAAASMTATHTPNPAGTVMPKPTATATHTPAASTVALTLSAVQALAGTSITLSAEGYGPDELVNIQLEAPGTGGTLHLLYALTNASGHVVDVKITIPTTLASGTYRLVAVGLHSGRRAETNLQVTAPQPMLHVSPTDFAPEDIIQVSGTQFRPDEIISLALSTTAGTASISLGQVQATNTGVFGPASIHVPFGLPAGALVLVATGRQSNLQASTPVTVHMQAATLAVNRTHLNPFATLAASGAHFEPGETVSLDLVELARTVHLTSAVVSSAGTFSVGTLTVPGTTPEGVVTLVATGASSHLSASVQLLVGTLPVTISNSPNPVVAGSAIHLTGSGYIPGETVTLTLAGPGGFSLTLANVIASTTGTVSVAQTTIPASTSAGTYTLVATGQASGRVARASITVQAPAPSAPILSIVDVSFVHGRTYLSNAGALISIAGSSFPPSTAISVALQGASSSFVLGVITTSSAGSFAPTLVTVPANVVPGSYRLVALIAGVNRASLAVQIVRRNPHLAVSNSTVSPGNQITVQGTGFAADEIVVLALNGAAVASQPSSILANASGSFSVHITVPQTLARGANVLSATGATSRVGASLTLQGTLPVASRWYFPFGDTTGDHQTVISLLNPSSSTANVTMTFLYQNAGEQKYAVSVPPHGVTPVSLNLAAGQGRYVSTIVEADHQIAAQTTIYNGRDDISTALGATAPGTLWYLAEGYTGGSFREYLTIMNPNPTVTTVDIRFLPFNGKPLQEVRFTVGAQSLIRFDAGLYMPAQSISAIVTASAGVVVDRTMRFGINQRGADDAVGIVQASTVWYFAQGDTAPDRQSFLTILNPNPAAPAMVTATLYDTLGRAIGAQTILVQALRRGNIKLNDILPVGDLAVTVTSSVPVVVERPQYVGPANLGQAIAGGDEFGRNGTAANWIFPAGDTSNQTSQIFSLFNPGLSTTQVTATFYPASGGAPISETLQIAPFHQLRLDASTIPGLPTGPFGVVMTAAAGQTFIAEQLSSNSAAGSFSTTQGIGQ